MEGDSGGTAWHPAAGTTGDAMRIATLLTTTAGLAVVGIPLALEAPAHAVTPGVQAGIGLGVSVRLGEKGEARRVGFQGNLFAEGAMGVDLDSGAVAGVELGLRGVPGAGVRGELLGRIGAGVMVLGNSWGHMNLAVGRFEGGVAFRRGDGMAPVMGATLRLPASRVRVLGSFSPLGDEARWFADVGLEVGGVPSNPTGIVDGRPLRDALGTRRPEVLIGQVPPAEARRWIEAGQDELEAVASFLNLADELRRLGAPAALVGRCLDAADDEAVHALLCLGRAAELGAGRVVAAPLAPRPRIVRDRASALRQLAKESWEDGYLNEGRAADRLEARASATREDRDARIQARIAAEERGHALLGRDVARWCLAA